MEEVLRLLAEDFYPEAERLVLVTDNLNTRTTACLCEAFAPDRVRTIAERLERHCPLSHGAWQNVAEIELAAQTKQRPGRRPRYVGRPRPGQSGGTAGWRRPAISDARIKLSSLDPSFRT